MSSAPGSTLVEVRDLVKTYTVGLRRRKVHAVRGLSFSVQRGEVFGIVGPNGAGKTSTIKILTGLMRQSAGSAELFGLPSIEVASRRRLGYLPEGPYFYEHLKPAELLSYYGRLHGMDAATLKRRIPALIERVGLSHAADRPLKKFSKGMRQRAGLAQALINDPELVILDEPQSGLDPLGRREVRDLIFELKGQGKTVVFSSHILPDVEAVCDRVALFHQGRIIEQGRLDDLLTERTYGYEVTLSGLSAEREEHVARRIPGYIESERRGALLEVHVALEGYDLVATAEAARALGARVEMVRPLREDLEQIFIRDTGEPALSPAEHDEMSAEDKEDG